MADAIAGARRTHIYGEWGDAIPARELYIRLLRIGIPVWFFDGAQSSQIAAGLLGYGDVALVVSRSGTDPVTLEFVRRSKAEGALTVAITGVPASPIGELADICFDTGTAVGGTWTEFFAGRASDTLTAGLLFVLVAQRIPDHLTANHPNGPGQPVVHPDPHPEGDCMQQLHVHSDLTVVGGGLAGVCAAIGAARQGSTVALIQNRPEGLSRPPAEELRDG